MLVREFTGGDPEIYVGLKAAYSDRDNWPKDWNSPLKPAVHESIVKVMRARKNQDC
jgi:hypothetical protein